MPSEEKDISRGRFLDWFLGSTLGGFTLAVSLSQLLIIGLVAAGCGISVLPSSFEGIHMEGVVYRPLADPQATTALMLARRTEGGGPLVEAFVALATAAAGEQ